MPESLGDLSLLLENKYALMFLQPSDEHNNGLIARKNDAQIKLIAAWSPQISIQGDCNYTLKM